MNPQSRSRGGLSPRRVGLGGETDYGVFIIEKVVHKLRRDEDTPQRDLEYWLSKTPEERLAAVEFLRRSIYDKMDRMPLVAKVINRETGEVIRTYWDPTRMYRKKKPQTKRPNKHS